MTALLGLTREFTKRFLSLLAYSSEGLNHSDYNGALLFQAWKSVGATQKSYSNKWRTCILGTTDNPKEKYGCITPSIKAHISKFT